MTQLSKTLAASAFAVALGFASVPAGAVAFNDFTVDEASVEGLGGLVNADKINGAYAERISFDGLGNFITNAFGDFGQFLTNDGTTLVPGVQLNNSYGMYALFASTGTVAGGPAIFTFDGAAASFSLWIDPDQDTTKTLGATGADPITLGNTADDFQIAFATDLSSGTGTLIAGTGGFFDLIFEDFTLTSPDGTDYFVSPSPFYFRVNVDGDFDSFVVSGNQTVTGDVSAVFIPEPGTLALVGLALLGLGFGMRRKA
jgi:hypothetical protein